MQMIEDVVAKRLSSPLNLWRLHPAGRLDVLPDSTRDALQQAEEATRERDGFHLTIAIGYDGREEIVDAVRSMLEEAARVGIELDAVAQRVTVEAIGAHLYTTGQPNPDLVIRTSGERRMSGFLL